MNDVDAEKTIEKLKKKYDLSDLHITFGPNATPENVESEFDKIQQACKDDPVSRPPVTGMKQRSIVDFLKEVHNE